MTEVQIGIAAALEQFGPRESVELAELAERHGFRGQMAADHVQPWVPAQGEASFVWSVLSAIGERTEGDFGPGVTCPSFRFHPALVAQAAATIEAMYPGRSWLGIGSGEALNEHMLAGYWPEAPERVRRMFEALQVIRKLFTGGDVKHAGEFFKLHTMRLWTMPDAPPPVYVAAAGPYTSRKAGELADGLITPGASLDKLAGILERFGQGARQAGKDPDAMPKLLQVHLSWAATDEQAWANAIEQWPNGGMKFPKADVRSPFDFEQMARLVRREDFAGRMVVSADPDEHRAALQSFIDAGFNRIYLHNVGRNQQEWLEVFGREVLPKLTA
ncbi:TIGR03557 family F420-dependent LLM class oxidoreductase [Haloechinothrix sp. LS1_15]|uniref:TIGR03557 family F420-dependent LLM class oxidoreductase n=1 Tax=Haloechinothrix sp. LS1_15 TaxID=2652248 RepID=UPI0029446C15|nr:TIGR03557 family F420-dependent LLM class oxidoreductase [Haloechinothrix sp. LS1_15]MDV6012909.1 TIGR03557 family F420-dependent LLM class oxidoreductase [Haloechinothrix sp. LS1_15]